MKKPALFLDRDGVINVDRGYVHRKQEFDFIDGIFELVAAANRAGFVVVVVTNQAGIGRGYYSENDFDALMDWVKERFAERGGKIDAVYCCPSHPEHGIGKYREDSYLRKPAPGMLMQAASDLEIDLSRSVMVGDQASDMEAGRLAGVTTLLQLGAHGAAADVKSIRTLGEAALYFGCGENPTPIERTSP